jgi:hypothetical protein
MSGGSGQANGARQIAERHIVAFRQFIENAKCPHKRLNSPKQAVFRLMLTNRHARSSPCLITTARATIYRTGMTCLSLFVEMLSNFRGKSDLMAAFHIMG